MRMEMTKEEEVPGFLESLFYRGLALPPTQPQLSLHHHQTTTSAVGRIGHILASVMNLEIVFLITARSASALTLRSLATCRGDALESLLIGKRVHSSKDITQFFDELLKTLKVLLFIFVYINRY